MTACFPPTPPVRRERPGAGRAAAAAAPQNRSSPFSIRLRSVAPDCGRPPPARTPATGPRPTRRSSNAPPAPAPRAMPTAAPRRSPDRRPVPPRRRSRRRRRRAAPVLGQQPVRLQLPLLVVGADAAAHARQPQRGVRVVHPVGELQPAVLSRRGHHLRRVQQVVTSSPGGYSSTCRIGADHT